MYVDAIYDRNKDLIRVVERINGERVYNDLDAEYVFYYEHPSGGHRSIFGDPCKKFTTNSNKKFRKEMGLIASGKGPNATKRRIFESDINPIFRVLANNYMGAETPKLNIGYFDIEVEFDPSQGFAPVEDPFNKVNAISVYCGWVQKLITLVLRPPTYTVEEAERVCATFEDTVLFDSEADLLSAFLDIIEDADVLTGWNSEGFDIPYLVNRITLVLGKDYTRKLCLWGQLPRERKMIQFKRERLTFDLVGRVHLDYLALYKKHNPQQLHSYRLDYVGEIEVGENKIPYEGTLDDLYRKDFTKFIAYNRQDTMLLPKIDQKKKFIELANQIAHSNCVLLKTTMGSVALVEQAIINEMHSMGFVVPDRKRDENASGSSFFGDDDDEDEDERTPVVGAYVAKPKKGLHDEVGACDINSLYPSTIRSLNMSPETIIGQVRLDETMALVEKRIAEGVPRAEAWDGIFHSLEYGHVAAKDGAALTIDFEDGTTKTMSGRQLYDHIFNPKNNLCITANGTIFRTDKDGMIPTLLAKWYSERKEMQGKQKEFEEAAKRANDPDTQKEAKFWAGFWDQRQQARKILLNSLYGALLNEGLRFYDERLGQSVTLTGRSIVRHMISKINEVILGDYNHEGDAIIYGDTDSCYFSAYHVRQQNEMFADFEWSRENVIGLYDGIADIVNDSFPEFMHRSFNTTLARGGIIKAGRELVASKGLFIKKKKYAVLMYDKEGFRLDADGKPGKLKAMGLDLKRADTPKFMQKFLEDLLMNVLTGKPREEMYDDIRTFRRAFKERPGWEKGTPKAVKALTDYAQREARSRSMAVDKNGTVGKSLKVNMPGHVRAALNWNHLCDTYGDRYSMRIGDGSKVIVCKLRSNLLKMDSVAYPIDEPHIPQWFKELPFDHELMETTIIDNKLDNLVGVLDWDLSETKEIPAADFFVFGNG